MSGGDGRIEGIHAILARERIPGSAAVVGHEGDVAALSVPTEHLARLAQLAPEIKALGFRYVAVELMPEDAQGAAS